MAVKEMGREIGLLATDPKGFVHLRGPPSQKLGHLQMNSSQQFPEPVGGMDSRSVLRRRFRGGGRSPSFPFLDSTRSKNLPASSRVVGPGIALALYISLEQADGHGI